jgi:uncharacterized MAPEG superfamily protein
MAPNLSIFAIPAFWIITMIPHNDAIALIKSSSNGRWDNTSPRSSLWDSKLQTTVPTEIYQRYERAEAAHKNGFENLPIFVGAILAGNIAKLDPWLLNIFAGIYLAMRVLYTMVYIHVRKGPASLFRTLIWFTSTMACMGVFVKAGFVLI